LSWIIRQCSSFAIGQSNTNIDVAAFIKAAEFYSSNQNWLDKPESFFVAPSSIPNVESKLVHGLKDGSILDLKFQSSYQIQYPDFEVESQLYPENKTVHARYWQHAEGAPATIVALHGWTMGDQRLNSLAFLPGQFYKLGLDVILVELPYHGRRKPKALTDAEVQNLFPGGKLALTNEALAQIIHDLRGLQMFLGKQGVENLGVVGMSLGAYVGALWASLDPLAFCIPIVPVVSMSDLAWKYLSRDANYKSFFEAGLTREILQAGYAVHCPLNHELKLSRDKVLILAGLADKIVPSAQPGMLWRHWQEPTLHRFRGGHLTQLKSPRALEKVIEFFRSNGWVK